MISLTSQSWLAHIFENNSNWKSCTCKFFWFRENYQLVHYSDNNSLESRAQYLNLDWIFTENQLLQCFHVVWLVPCNCWETFTFPIVTYCSRLKCKLFLGTHMSTFSLNMLKTSKFAERKLTFTSKFPYKWQSLLSYEWSKSSTKHVLNNKTGLTIVLSISWRHPLKFLYLIVRSPQINWHVRVVWKVENVLKK